MESLLLNEVIADSRICSRCGISHDEGYYCDDDNTYYCGDACLDAELNEVYGVYGWEKTEEENEAGGFVNEIDSNGNRTGLNLFWTQWVA